MRYFHGLAFLGAGSVHDRHLLDHVSRSIYLEKNPAAQHSNSFIQVEALKLRLEHAISELGALQQGETDPACRQELEDAVRDICAGLLGKEIVFGEATSYPPEPANLEGLSADSVVRAIYSMRMNITAEMVPTPRILGWREEYKGTSDL